MAGYACSEYSSFDSISNDNYCNEAKLISGNAEGKENNERKSKTSGDKQRNTSNSSDNEIITSEISSAEKVDYSKFAELPPDKEFHLFVSYSSEDREEVKEIIAQLESRYLLRCMDFEKDFHPGKPLEENIAFNMQKSLKVLIFLSPNYLNSYCCVIEARDAFTTSFNEYQDQRIIPVLLKPFDKALPSYLKSYVYIDAQKEKDVAERIGDAFYNQAAVDALQSEKRIAEQEQRRQNGSRLLVLDAIESESFTEKGVVYEFPSLSEYDKKILKYYNVQCEEQYEAIVKYVNSRQLMIGYRCLKGGLFAYLSSFLILVLIIFFAVGVNNLLMLVTKVEYTPFVYLVAVPFSLIASIISRPLFYACRLSFGKRLHKRMWKLNKSFYKDSKCLVIFDNTNRQKPIITVIRYDTTKCQEYMEVLLRRQFTENNEKIKDMAADLVEKILAELQINGDLMKWESIPISHYNRHNIWRGKSCLCQLIEHKYATNPYGGLDIMEQLLHGIPKCDDISEN